MSATGDGFAPDEAATRLLLHQLARDSDFSALGVAPCVLAGEEERLRKWLEAGYHAQMKWLETSSKVRVDLRRRFPWAKSVLVVARAYPPRTLPLHDEYGLAPFVSSYARGQDYHRILLQRLQELGNRLQSALAPRPLKRHAYVDTGPVLERQLAVAAGLGWLGKNGLLLNGQYGSWAFLGVLVTDLELKPGLVSQDASLGSCGSCRACQPACPTDAFVAPGVLDSRRCISYLTIEHRGPIPRELRHKMGAWLFGCDLCQTSCPIAHHALSQKREQAEEDFTDPSAAVTGITLPELLFLNEEEFRRRFKSTPLWRPRREGLLRNALIVAANLRRSDCIDPARQLLRDPSPVLREAASWCLAQLEGQAGAFELKAALQRESDPEVKSLMAQDLIRLAAGGPR